jgi:hypothetical protein
MFRTPTESRSIPFNAGPSRRQKNCKCGQIPAECDCNENSETEEDSIEPVSISPTQTSRSQPIFPWQSVRRRIDFSVSPPSSPRRIEPKSPSVEVIAHHAPPADAPPAEESFGECGVCYSDLPARSNHVATVCGHLFCVRCFLRWHLSSTTCPMCRKKLYEGIDDFEFEQPESEMHEGNVAIMEDWGSPETADADDEHDASNHMHDYLRSEFAWSANVEQDDRNDNPQNAEAIEDLRNQILMGLATQDTDSFRHVPIQPDDYLHLAFGPDRIFEVVMLNGNHWFGSIENVRVLGSLSSEYYFEMLNSYWIEFFQAGNLGHPQEIHSETSIFLSFNQIQRVYLIQQVIRVD